ncbi:MAG: hypothetical protein ABFD16_29770 [Thermoguttaceae bacterium]
MHASVWAALAIVGLFAMESLAVTPIPRAYYDFEQIDSGKFFRNVANPGVFDGYLGLSSTDTARHPDIVPGLHGSLHALKFDSSDIARVPGLVTDANHDRLDEDVFRGAFSVFARVDPTNVAQMHILNADRGPLDTMVRGWYMDFSNSEKNTNGEYLLNPRFSAGGSGVYIHATGSETTNYKNVESFAITWLPATIPGSTMDGLMQIYINGVLYAGSYHKSGTIVMNEAGFNLGYDNLVSYGQGIVIDDIAVWDRFLTAADMQELHTQGVTLPEPGACVLATWGVLTLALIRLLSHRISPQN